MWPYFSSVTFPPGVAFVPRTWRGFDDLFPWRLAANTEGVDGTSNAKGKKGFAGGRKRVTNQVRP